MPAPVLFRNAQLVNEGQLFESDLRVSNGRIERIDRDIRPQATDSVVDAAGMLLIPGVIDDQVHFREPGLTHKGDIGSESRAGVAGGVTSFMEMPNTRPPTTTFEELAAKYAIAERSAAANFGFYFGATNDNIDAIRALDPLSCCGIKVFMGSSTGNMLVDDEETLSAIFREAPVPVATHCESTPMIDAALEKAVAQFGPDIPVTQHPFIRDRHACFRSTQQAVSLARRYQTQLHVLHLSTADELSLFEPGPVANKHITVETCIHFLHFCDEDYPRLGNRIKCNPSIKSASDRDALLQAVADGRIDIIATDHAPHTLEEKANPDYRSSPSGMPLVQDVLLAALELADSGQIPLGRVVETMCHNPALRFNVRERGFLREGYFADLVLVDPRRSTAVTPDRVLSRCGWSPFEGRVFGNRISSTWINGVMAFDGERVIEHGAAMRLAFDRAR